MIFGEVFEILESRQLDLSPLLCSGRHHLFYVMISEEKW